MIRPSTSCQFPSSAHSPSKSVHFQLDNVSKSTLQLDNVSEASSSGKSHATPIRSILKGRQFSNLLKMANDKMLRQLEQCVEERDRIVASIDCSPVDVSRLSPRTQRAQTRYREDMAEDRDRISALIEDKFNLLRQTLKEEDMPSWMSEKENSDDFTLRGYKKPTQLKLFRRQSSLLLFQSCIGKAGMNTNSAYSWARNSARQRHVFARCDSEGKARDNSSDLLTRISQRLAAH